MKAYQRNIARKDEPDGFVKNRTVPSRFLDFALKCYRKGLRTAFFGTQVMNEIIFLKVRL